MPIGRLVKGVSGVLSKHLKRNEIVHSHSACMTKKNWWYVFLGIVPTYGANNSLQQFGEPWSGLVAGVVVTGIFLGSTKGVQLLMRKAKRKRGADEF